MEIQAAVIGAFAALAGVVVTLIATYLTTRATLRETRRIEYQKYLSTLMEKLIESRGESVNTFVSNIDIDAHPDMRKLKKEFEDRATAARARFISACFAVPNPELHDIAQQLQSLPSNIYYTELQTTAITKLGAIIAELTPKH